MVASWGGDGVREVLTVAHRDTRELQLRETVGVLLPERLPLLVYVPLGQALGVRESVESMDSLAHWEGEADTVVKEALGVLLAVVEKVAAMKGTEGQVDTEAVVDKVEDPDSEEARGRDGLHHGLR